MGKLYKQIFHQEYLVNFWVGQLAIGLVRPHLVVVVLFTQ
tara:strand:- start:321 stop:440 length:120 start_codon:yes stop_codon:yes gene_type:complete